MITIAEFKCPTCGKIEDKTINLTGIQVCSKCGTPMYKLFSTSSKFDFREPTKVELRGAM